jgi:3-oxoacyl-[acyl-carrier-protein] synthase II
MSHNNLNPAGASRPFDRGRDGFVMSEGSAVVVLEELESARARGARIYAELSGYAATADAFHPTRPDGHGARRCVEQALARARCAPGDLGYVNAHGTATRLNDTTEAATYQAVLGPDRHRVPVSSTKGTTGHLLGAAGSLEAALTVLALHDGLLPPTVNLDDIDPACEDLHHVRGQAREARPTTALSSSFGFGGQNACLIFTRPGHHRGEGP